MNKLLFTFLLSIGICATAIAQEKQMIFENDQISITSKTTLDCNPTNNAIPNTYMLLTYTNKTAQAIDFNFELDLWYNQNGNVFKSDLSPKDVSDEPLLKTIHLAPHAIKSGACENSSKMFKLFYKHNHPKMDISLSDIQIVLK